MGITQSYKKHVAGLPFGEYQAHLVSIDEVESKMTPREPGEVVDPLSWKWTWRLSDGSFANVEVTKLTSRIFSEKSHAYAYARVMGHPGGGVDFDDRHILGKPCRLQIKVTEKPDGSSFNDVIGVLSPVKSQTAIDLSLESNIDADADDFEGAPRPVGLL